MMYKPIALTLAALALAMLPAVGANAIEYGDPLVGNVFITGFDGWTDTYDGPRTPVANWGVLLTGDKALMESSDTILGVPGSASISSAATPLGRCDVFKMVNLTYSTPSDYTLTAKIGSWDDDGFGLIFAYQDENNYFRISNRAQDADSYGYPRGVSVQKVVNGVVTHLAQNLVIRPAIPVLTAGTNEGVFFDLAVTVSGNSYTVQGNYGLNGPAATVTTYISETDSNLADMAAGHYGVHSWAQRYRLSSESSTFKEHGTIVESLTVSSPTVNRTHVFADAVATDWRLLRMTDANGDQNDFGFGYGNFRQDFRNGTIVDDTNSFKWATTTLPNVDFVGVGVAIDTPGNAEWTDYEMTVRVLCLDDEGPGVLVRVQDDNTFYRINFAAERMDTRTNKYERPPQGMSIQKCVDGGEGNAPIWTELFRDSQLDPADPEVPGPLFVYGYGANARPFDLKVQVIGNMIKVQVIDDPDGAATVIDYDAVYDTDTPILSGSVGLTNWGAGHAGNGLIYSAYGDIEGHALVTYVPEPSTFVLLGLMGLCGLAVRRRS